MQTYGIRTKTHNGQYDMCRIYGGRKGRVPSNYLIIVLTHFDFFSTKRLDFFLLAKVVRKQFIRCVYKHNNHIVGMRCAVICCTQFSSTTIL